MKLEPRVIIVSVGENLPRKLRETLLLKKFESLQAETIDSATRLVRDGVAATILVCYGEDQDEGFAALKEVLTSPSLHLFPLVVVGAEAATLRPELIKVLSHVGALDTPTTVEAIANEVARLWELFKTEHQQRQDEIARGLDSAVKPEGEAGLFRGFKSIPEECFAHLESLGLLRITIGGALYATTTKRETFLNFVELDGAVLDESSQRALKGADAWVLGHSTRVAYITNRLLTAASLSREEVIQATKAALLHVVSFKTKRRLARMDYFSATDPDVRKRAGAAIRESATKVSFDLRMPQESLVLALFARLVVRDEVSRDKDQFKLASAILAADFLDRVTWTQGFFNPQRAYIVLRSFKEGAFSFIHPAVCAALVKFASEAIVASPPQMALPRRMYHALREKKSAGEPVREPPRVGEVEIPLEQLSPGMRLSRPLTTFDGREVLEPDLKLDEDLIWRVWQLAAVRPVQSAMICSRRQPEVSPPPAKEMADLKTDVSLPISAADDQSEAPTEQAGEVA